MNKFKKNAKRWLFSLKKKSALTILKITVPFTAFLLLFVNLNLISGSEDAGWSFLSILLFTLFLFYIASSLLYLFGIRLKEERIKDEVNKEHDKNRGQFLKAVLVLSAGAWLLNLGEIIFVSLVLFPLSYSISARVLLSLEDEREKEKLVKKLNSIFPKMVRKKIREAELLILEKDGDKVVIFLKNRGNPLSVLLKNMIFIPLEEPPVPVEEKVFADVSLSEYPDFILRISENGKEAEVFEEFFSCLGVSEKEKKEYTLWTDNMKKTSSFLHSFTGKELEEFEGDLVILNEIKQENIKPDKKKDFEKAVEKVEYRELKDPGIIFAQNDYSVSGLLKFLEFSGRLKKRIEK